MKFSERLSALGFGSYAEYLASEHWSDFRRRYKTSGERMTCLVCSGKPIQLHHQTYVRLGRERFGDVVPVCRAHHTAIHDWLKSSGKVFVEYTREAVAALGGESLAVLPSRVRGKQTGLAKRDERRARKQAKRRQKQSERFRRAEEAKKRKRAEREAAFEVYRRELKRLTDANVIRGGQYVAACKSLNVEQAESLIRKGRKRIANGVTVRDRTEKVVKSVKRSCVPFRPNDKPGTPTDTGSWRNYLTKLRGEPKGGA